MPKLVVTLPEAGGEQTFELTEPTVTVGRLPENTLQIDDPSVSSRHAQFTLGASGNYEIKDLGSTNGTRVNGAHITETGLNPGDRLRLGKIEAVYLSDVGGSASGGTAEAQPLPAASAPAVALSATAARGKPADFANASPFAKRTKEKDPAGRAILVFAAVSLLLFAAALVCVFMLQPPANLGS
ncbi:MAG: FHA domain-containing protein [Verrucomicrobia bacterium]|nr:FHA domain-containing protein [Verrucomicrobiota bacterium]